MSRAEAQAMARRMLDGGTGATIYFSLAAHKHRLRIAEAAKALGVWQESDWGRLLHLDAKQAQHRARLFAKLAEEQS